MKLLLLLLLSLHIHIQASSAFQVYKGTIFHRDTIYPSYFGSYEIGDSVEYVIRIGVDRVISEGTRLLNPKYNERIIDTSKDTIAIINELDKYYLKNWKLIISKTHGEDTYTVSERGESGRFLFSKVRLVYPKPEQVVTIVLDKKTKPSKIKIVCDALGRRLFNRDSKKRILFTGGGNWMHLKEKE